jgi:F-type H+-transporting ATPase subunit alpha
MCKQVTILYAGTRGFLDKYPVSALASYEKQLYEFVESKHPDVFADLESKKAIDDDLDAKLKKALGEFDGVFQA